MKLVSTLRSPGPVSALICLILMTMLKLNKSPVQLKLPPYLKTSRRHPVSSTPAFSQISFFLLISPLELSVLPLSAPSLETWHRYPVIETPTITRPVLDDCHLLDVVSISLHSNIFPLLFPWQYSYQCFNRPEYTHVNQVNLFMC